MHASATMGAKVRSWRCVLAALAILAMASVSACDGTGWVADPVTQHSEVTARVWYCTPAHANGQPGHEKAANSAVKMEIVTAAPPAPLVSTRFAPNTVLGQATAAGEVWPAGSIHQLFISWLQPDVTRTDLEQPSLRVRITQDRGSSGPLQSVDPWAFSFFISLDVVTYTDDGDPSIGWHLAVISTDYLLADPDRQVLLDVPISELRGWPHPCPTT
jgi:hypothetical protein